MEMEMVFHSIDDDSRDAILAAGGTIDPLVAQASERPHAALFLVTLPPGAKVNGSPRYDGGYDVELTIRERAVIVEAYPSIDASRARIAFVEEYEYSYDPEDLLKLADDLDRERHAHRIEHDG